MICSPAYGPGLHEVAINFQGGSRKILLNVPEDLPAGELVPGVVDWHGYSEAPWYQNLLVGLDEFVDRNKWVGVLPFGTGELFPTETCCPAGCDADCCERGLDLDQQNSCGFNAGSCCGVPGRVDDVGLARYLVDTWLPEQMCVDRELVFALGFSNGGMMTNRAACQASDLFKAVGPVSGNVKFSAEFRSCEPTTPLSWFSVCGDADSVCNVDLESSVKIWAEAQNCDISTDPVVTMGTGTTTCRAYTDCTGPRDSNVTAVVPPRVEWCWVDGLEHEWSGRNRPDRNVPQDPENIDASEFIFGKFEEIVRATRAARREKDNDGKPAASLI